MTSNNNITRDKPSLFPSSFFPSIPCVDALILILTPPNRKPVYLLPFDCNKLVVALFSVFDSYVDVLVLFIILSTLILFHNNNCLVDLIIHYFCPLLPYSPTWTSPSYSRINGSSTAVTEKLPAAAVVVLVDVEFKRICSSADTNDACAFP